jgi:hypothetical protein
MRPVALRPRLATGLPIPTYAKIWPVSSHARDRGGNATGNLVRTARVRFAAIFALVAGALAFGTAASAGTGKGNGAQQVNIDDCTDNGLITTCSG